MTTGAEPLMSHIVRVVQRLSTPPCLGLLLLSPCSEPAAYSFPQRHLLGLLLCRAKTATTTTTTTTPFLFALRLFLAVPRPSPFSLLRGAGRR